MVDVKWWNTRKNILFKKGQIYGRAAHLYFINLSTQFGTLLIDNRFVRKGVK